MNFMKKAVLIAMMLSTAAHAHTEITAKPHKFDLNLKDLIKYQCDHYPIMSHESCLRLLDRCVKDRVYRYGTNRKPPGKRIARAFDLCREEF